MTYYLMNTNVYNIVWADDEIDAILDEVIVDLKENGFNIVGTAHDGKELEERLSKPELIDAVIVALQYHIYRIFIYRSDGIPHSGNVHFVFVSDQCVDLKIIYDKFHAGQGRSLQIDSQVIGTAVCDQTADNDCSDKYDSQDACMSPKILLFHNTSVCSGVLCFCS